MQNLITSYCKILLPLLLCLQSFDNSIKVAIPEETIWTQLYYSKFVSFHRYKPYF